MRKELREALQKADPNLKIVSRHRSSREDWEKAGGAKCSTCGSEIFQTHGPFKQCLRCLYKEKGTFLEEIDCPKCRARALQVSTLAHATQTVKIVCPLCGTYAL